MAIALMECQMSHYIRSVGLAKSRVPLQRSTSASKAFTLVELLVVIGIIAVLISILLPALGRAKRQAVQVQCGSNLHNLGLAMLCYANDNKGRLPQFYSGTAYAGSGAGSWLWDVEVGTRNALMHYGAIRKTLYCPRNIDAMNTEGLFDFAVTPATPLTGPIPNQTGYCVLGYFFLINRPDGGYPNSEQPAPASPPVPQNYKWNYQTTISPNNSPYSTANVAAPIARPNISSQTEIVTDATLSEGSNRTTATFGNITGGYVYPHQSAHWYGGQPLGGNILFLDGHGEWRPFKQMQPRAVPIAGNPFFWW